MVRLRIIYSALIFILGCQTAFAAPPTAEQALTDRVMGDPNAPIELVEYASLTCPHCANFHMQILPKIKEKYIDTGKIKLVFRDFPFDRLGLMASVLARCGKPNRYFSFLHVLFESQENWTSDKDPVAALKRIGKLGGLSEADYQACLENNDLINGIVKIRKDAMDQHSVESTPTFIINGEKRIVGSQPFDVFDDIFKKITK